MLHSRLLNEAETLRTAATLIRRRNPNQAAAAQVNDDTARACEADAALLAADESNRLVHRFLETDHMRRIPFS